MINDAGMVLLNQRKREIQEDWNMLRDEAFVSEKSSFAYVSQLIITTKECLLHTQILL